MGKSHPEPDVDTLGFQLSPSVMSVAGFLLCTKEHRVFLKIQPSFLLPAAKRSDIKEKRELPTALGKRWVTL